jgi:phage tail sheath protein FI
MRVYQTPGVIHERADAAHGGVAALRTDVTALVGIAQRGPVNLAVPVESFRQFVAWFGECFDAGYLAYCARGFFENGGRRLWVVRVASPAAARAHVAINDALGAAWRIEASSPGVWGDELAVRAVETRRVRVRGALDPLDARRLAVPDLAGFTPHTLIEIRRGADRARAVVAAVETTNGGARLQLAQAPVPPLPPGGDVVRIETVALTLELHARGRLVAVYPDLSLVPAHERYGPRVLKQPWQMIDPQSPEATAARVAELDLAVDFFRVARDRQPQPPPPIVVRELRDAVRRAALLPFDTVGTAPAPTLPLAGDAPSPAVPLRGGADGLAALAVEDFIGYPVTADADPELRVQARRGIAALDVVDEAALVAVPDIHIRPDPQPRFLPPVCVPDPCLPAPPGVAPLAPLAIDELPPVFSASAILRVQQALIEQCERRRDRFALLDAPLACVERLTFAVTELRDWRARFDSAFGALYAPWLRVVDPRRSASGTAGAPRTRLVPPSGHVAGLVAATDLRDGVHVAPANAPLAWVHDVSLPLDDERHGLLNTLGVDVIRPVEGRGVRVLGARTMASDRSWQFIPVRRLVSMIARALEAALAWAVFEPNDWRTRTKLALVVGSFLRSLWRRGALAGARAEEAFFVRCDESNNPPDARDRGELLIEIGVAPVIPAEFIVLRIGRDANGFALAESSSAVSAA